MEQFNYILENKFICCNNVITKRESTKEYFIDINYTKISFNSYDIVNLLSYIPSKDRCEIEIYYQEDLDYIIFKDTSLDDIEKSLNELSKYFEYGDTFSVKICITKDTTDYNVTIYDNKLFTKWVITRNYFGLEDDITNRVRKSCDNIKNSVNNYLGSIKNDILAVGLFAILFLISINLFPGEFTVKIIFILMSSVLLSSFILCILSAIVLLMNIKYHNKIIDRYRDYFPEIMDSKDNHKNKVLKTANKNFIIAITSVT